MYVKLCRFCIKKVGRDNHSLCWNISALNNGATLVGGGRRSCGGLGGGWHGRAIARGCLEASLRISLDDVFQPLEGGDTLIPVLDNFEMALQAASEPKAGSTEALKTGVTMIASQLRNVMSEAGLEEISATDKMFDPNFHEAVSQQETTDVPEGRVLQQLRKGYKLRDRLIRPASVVVAKKSAA